MEIKNFLIQKDIEDTSHVKKIQPVIKNFFRENYDIVLEEIEWDKYFPGKYVYKKA